MSNCRGRRPRSGSSSVRSRLRTPSSLRDLGAASGSLHPTRIEAHARSRLGDASGEALPPRPRSSSVPSYRPPHGDDLEGSLSPGSGEGQSGKRSSARRSRWGDRERERGSNQGMGLPDLRAHDRCLLALAGARGRRDLVRARSLRLSLDDGLPHPSLPQLTVAAKRSISNALPRSRM